MHHPGNSVKKIATAYKNYSVVFGSTPRIGNYVTDDMYQDCFVKQVVYLYYALASDQNPIFMRCTLGGSSGAPLFDGEWRLVGMHLGGLYRSENRSELDFVSEGRPIHHIILDLYKQLKRTGFSE